MLSKSLDAHHCWLSALAAPAWPIVSSCAIWAQAAGVPGDWSFVTKQIGMFCYTGLTGASGPPYSFKPAPSWGRGSLLLPLCAPPHPPYCSGAVSGHG
ncbi:MAG: hypothetical protein ACK55I_00445, partial [bacterium]